MSGDSVERWSERGRPVGHLARDYQNSLQKPEKLAYAPGELEYGGEARDSCWEKLGSNARRALQSRVGGELLEWWASSAGDGRYRAVALGPDAVCKAEPTTGDKGQLAYRMKPLRFVPDSLDQLTKRYTEDAGLAGEGSGSGEHAASPLAVRLGKEFCGFLGNLPPEAQQVIQGPYQPQPDLVYDYFYERKSDLPEMTWLFWCYLADNRVLTFCSGKKVTPRGESAGKARWTINFYRARIA